MLLDQEFKDVPGMPGVSRASHQASEKYYPCLLSGYIESTSPSSSLSKVAFTVSTEAAKVAEGSIPRLISLEEPHIP